MSRERKIKIGGVIILSFFFWIIILKNIPSSFWEYGGDSAQYIILAESFLSSNKFHMINYPQQPFSTHYPPVFPLLLFPIIFFWGRNFYLMHLLVSFLGYLSLFFLYYILRKYANWKFALFIISFFAFNRFFIYYASKNILSDVPYLFFSSLVLFSALKYLSDKRTICFWGILVLLTSVLSYFCRYIGLMLFLGLILVFYLKKEKKKFYFLLFPFFTIFIFWNVLGFLHPNPFIPSHLKIFFLLNNYAPFKGNIFQHPSQIFPRFIDGIDYYCGIITQAIIPLIKSDTLAGEIFSLIIFSFVLFGFGISYRNNKLCIFHYYFLLYFLLISSANPRLFGEGSRYILPILPFIFFYFFTSLQKILSKFSPIVYFFFLSIFLINLQFLPRHKNDFERLPVRLKNFFSIHYWIKDNLPKEGVIVSRKPPLTYFLTSHKSIPYPYTPYPQQIWRWILKYKAKYIIVDEVFRETYYYLSRFLYHYAEDLKLLYRIGNTAVFEIKYQK